MAFTRNGAHAADFGSRTTKWSGTHFVLFRLRLSDVARGTPWVWYAGEDQEKQVRGRECAGKLTTSRVCIDALRRLHFLGWEAAQEGGYEEETLLPPGTLTVKHVTRVDNAMRQALSATNKKLMPSNRKAVASVSWIDVAFTPDARYAMQPRRKGTREANSNVLWNVFAPMRHMKRTRANASAPAAKQQRPRRR